MTQKSRWIVLVAALAVWAMSSPASAAIITSYTSQASFLLALGEPPLTDPFDDTDLGPFVTVTSGWSSFSISGGVLHDRVADFLPPEVTVWTFGGAGISAFGGFWNTTPGGEGTGLDFAVDFVAGGSQGVPDGVQPSSAFLTPSFFGFISDTPIDTLTISGDIETVRHDRTRIRACPGARDIAAAGFGYPGSRSLAEAPEGIRASPPATISTSNAAPPRVARRCCAAPYTRPDTMTLVGPARVAHVLLSLRTGGLERVAVDLVNCAGPDFAPFLVCLETSGPMASELRKPATQIVVVNRKPGFRPWLALPLSRTLRAQGARIVHTHNTAAGFYGALAGQLARIPVVHTKHGQNLDGGNQARLSRVAYVLTDHVVAVSEPARALASREGARSDRLSIIDNGVDLARFSGSNERRAAARERVGVVEGEVVVGTVGRLAAVKNQRLLIEGAGDAALATGRRIVLVIVGEGPEHARLASASEVARPGLRVVLPGAGRAEEWLPAFDIFAMSSDSEGLPIALLEAMACALPAVVTSVGAMPEVVDHGRAGLVVPPGNREALAQAIASLCGDTNRRAALGAAGLRRVEERHSASRMARDYEALYRKVLGLPTSPRASL